MNSLLFILIRLNSLYIYVCSFVCPSIYLSMHPSIYLPIYLFVIAKSSTYQSSNLRWLHFRKENTIVFPFPYSVSASVFTSVRLACRLATLAGNCTAWNMEFSPTATSVRDTRSLYAVNYTSFCTYTFPMCLFLNWPFSSYFPLICFVTFIRLLSIDEYFYIISYYICTETYPFVLISTYDLIEF